MPRTTFYGLKGVKVTYQPNIGLDATVRQSVVKILNLLLADEGVLSLKLNHSNEQTGENDGNDLESLYDDQYEQIKDIITEIAERVGILGGSYLCRSEDLVNSARLDGEFSKAPSVMNILADQEAFIRFLREDAQKCFEIYEDHGTFAMLVNVLRMHEKMAWMLRPYIKNNPIQGESPKRKEDKKQLKN
jgi:starvation-inducible DNA-binding protein